MWRKQIERGVLEASAESFHLFEQMALAKLKRVPCSSAARGPCPTTPAQQPAPSREDWEALMRRVSPRFHEGMRAAMPGAGQEASLARAGANSGSGTSFTFKHRRRRWVGGREGGREGVCLSVLQQRPLTASPNNESATHTLRMHTFQSKSFHCDPFIKSPDREGGCGEKGGWGQYAVVRVGWERSASERDVHTSLPRLLTCPHAQPPPRRVSPSPPPPTPVHPPKHTHTHHPTPPATPQ
jgi:hypothetical protein